MNTLRRAEIKNIINSFENLEETLNELRVRIDVVRVNEENDCCEDLLVGDDLWCLENALNMLKAFKVNRLIDWLAEVAN